MRSESRFLKVKCTGCNNEQIIFNKPSRTVKCLVCEKVLIEPAGGTGQLNKNAEILDVLRR